MLIVLALIVVVAVAAGVLGVAKIGRDVGVPPVVLVGAAIVGLLVLLTAAFGFRGLGASDDDSPTDASAPPSTRRSEPTLVINLPGSRIETAPGDLPVVGVRAADPNRFPPETVADNLQRDSVVRVLGTGFEPFETGWVEQCITELGRLPSCAGGFPVQFDEDGEAELQYQLHSSFAPGGCRSGRPTCVLRVIGAGSGREGMTQTVFLDARRGRITVEPGTGLADGQVVRVSVTGFPENVAATAMLCAPPSGYDPRRCGSAGGAATFTIGPDGQGGTDLPIRAGRLGTEGEPCGPRITCGVSVVTDEGFVAAPVVPIRFSRGPGAAYEPRRVAVGLAIALVLSAIALALARTTDWHKPTEAATPEVDGADLQTSLSLDQLFGTDEEIDARDPVQL